MDVVSFYLLQFAEPSFQVVEVGSLDVGGRTSRLSETAQLTLEASLCRLEEEFLSCAQSLSRQNGSAPYGCTCTVDNRNGIWVNPKHTTRKMLEIFSFWVTFETEIHKNLYR